MAHWLNNDSVHYFESDFSMCFKFVIPSFSKLIIIFFFADKLKDERTIEVLNAGCKDSATGEMKSASGVAVFDPENPGQLTVGFKTPPKDNNKPNCKFLSFPLFSYSMRRKSPQ